MREEADGPSTGGAVAAGLRAVPRGMQPRLEHAMREGAQLSALAGALQHRQRGIRWTRHRDIKHIAEHEQSDEVDTDKPTVQSRFDPQCMGPKDAEGIRSQRALRKSGQAASM